jgi:hypothetical protein
MIDKLNFFITDVFLLLDGAKVRRAGFMGNTTFLVFHVTQVD